MSKRTYSRIIGTGSFVPHIVVKNEEFLNREFLDESGGKYDKTNSEIVEKFQQITTIDERRYAGDEMVTSDLGFEAAKRAIESAGISGEELDHIIFAHNFGDVKKGSNRSDFVPSLASRVKSRLGIENPGSVCYDIAFGCPGWLQAVVQADYLIRSGDFNKVLVIGAEVLSRVSDPHDRDSMIYSDGAGAVVLQGEISTEPKGILGHSARSDAHQYSQMLHMGASYHPNGLNEGNIYLKMNGRKLYQYALTYVPQAIKDCLDKCEIPIGDVSKLLIHQANGKMDEAILKRLYKLYGEKNVPDHIMPMTISWLGNSSVATIPTLLDLILRGELENHQLEEGQIVVLASVGAGMNINALVYRM